MEKEILETLVNQGLSTIKISKALNKSRTNVRYWLEKHSLKTNFLSPKEININNKGDDKFCSKCSNFKDKKEFYNKRGKIGNSAYCIDCTKLISNERSRDFKKQIVDYKGGCCEKCGYNKCIGALEFHHLNPYEKDFSFGKVKNYNITERIKKELDKCILVCANCHREIHEEQNKLAT